MMPYRCRLWSRGSNSATVSLLGNGHTKGRVGIELEGRGGDYTAAGLMFENFHKKDQSVSPRCIVHWKMNWKEMKDLKAMFCLVSPSCSSSGFIQ